MDLYESNNYREQSKYFIFEHFRKRGRGFVSEQSFFRFKHRCGPTFAFLCSKKGTDCATWLINFPRKNPTCKLPCEARGGRPEESKKCQTTTRQTPNELKTLASPVNRPCGLFIAVIGRCSCFVRRLFNAIRNNDETPAFSGHNCVYDTVGTENLIASSTERKMLARTERYARFKTGN